MQIVISAVVLILCIAAFVFFCLRGHSPLIVGLCCAFVVSFVAKEGFIACFFTQVPESIGSSIGPVFFLFLLSAILGELFHASGFAERIGLALTHKIPRTLIPFVLVALSSLFALAGIPRREFIIAAIAYPLLHAADLPLYLGLVCDMGATTVVNWGITGLPGLPNILAGTSFGIEDLAYVPEYSWPATVFGMILLCCYITFLVKRAERRHEGYSESGTGLFTALDKTSDLDDNAKQPPLLLALSPIVCLLAVCILLSSVLKVDGTVSAVFALCTAILVLIVCGRRYLKAGDTMMAHISAASRQICPILLTVGVITAFAVAVSHTPVYDYVIESLFRAEISPYLLTMIVVGMLGVLTCDGIATLLVLKETGIATSLAASGMASVPVLATVARLSAAAFGSLPWSVAAIIPMQIYGMVNRNGVIKVFVTMTLIPILMILFVLGMSAVFHG